MGCHCQEVPLSTQPFHPIFFYDYSEGVYSAPNTQMARRSASKCTHHFITLIREPSLASRSLYTWWQTQVPFFVTCELALFCRAVCNVKWSFLCLNYTSGRDYGTPLREAVNTFIIQFQELLMTVSVLGVWKCRPLCMNTRRLFAMHETHRLTIYTNQIPSILSVPRFEQLIEALCI